MNAPKFDDALIEAGRRLRELDDSPLFDPLKKEWDERIDQARSRRDGWSPGFHPAEALACIEVELRTLTSLRDFISEQIEAGGSELMRKQNYSDSAEGSQK